MPGEALHEWKMKLVSSAKRYANDETGSISLLLVFLFLVVAITSLVVIDIADAYLAKRQLVQIGEASAQIGARQIDINRYYSQGLVNNGLGYQQVPIDCNSAVLKAQQFLFSNTLRGNQIFMTGWSCVDEKLELRIRSEIRPLIAIPIVNSIYGNRFLIYAKVIATAAVR